MNVDIYILEYYAGIKNYTFEDIFPMLVRKEFKKCKTIHNVISFIFIVCVQKMEDF